MSASESDSEVIVEAVPLKKSKKTTAAAAVAFSGSDSDEKQAPPPPKKKRSSKKSKPADLAPPPAKTKRVKQIKSESEPDEDDDDEDDEEETYVEVKKKSKKKKASTAAAAKDISDKSAAATKKKRDEVPLKLIGKLNEFNSVDGPGVSIAMNVNWKAVFKNLEAAHPHHDFSVVLNKKSWTGMQLLRFITNVIDIESQGAWTFGDVFDLDPNYDKLPAVAYSLFLEACAMYSTQLMSALDLGNQSRYNRTKFFEYITLHSKKIRYMPHVSSSKEGTLSLDSMVWTVVECIQYKNSSYDSYRAPLMDESIYADFTGGSAPLLPPLPCMTRVGVLKTHQKKGKGCGLGLLAGGAVTSDGERYDFKHYLIKADLE